MKMRLFIAVDIDEKIRHAVAQLQDEMAAEADMKKGDVKWVRPEKMHLTLKFLGQVKDEKSVEICTVTGSAAEQHKAFDLDIETVGCFGGKSPKVLWVGTESGSEELCALAGDIEKRLAEVGWPEEARKFSGHLTLCRIKNFEAGKKLAQISKNYSDIKLGTVLIDAVTVYQSQLTPTGPIYTALGSYRLRVN